MGNVVPSISIAIARTPIYPEKLKIFPTICNFLNLNYRNNNNLVIIRVILRFNKQLLVTIEHYRKDIIMKLLYRLDMECHKI